MAISTTTKPSSATMTTLAAFASVMVQWLWYGTPISSSSHNHGPFTTFCFDILTATSLSSSCVLLGLKYIQTLKRANPSIKGAAGSEYRLFTAALMLANKYLEDSAYTNATFSELSKIPINEINQMEMEFLAVLDYSLYVSETHYLQWLKECEIFVTSQGYSASLSMLRPIKAPISARRASAVSLSTAQNPSAPKTSALTYPYKAAPLPLPSVSHAKRSASDVFGSQATAPQYKRASIYGLHTPPSHAVVAAAAAAAAAAGGRGPQPVVIAPVPTYPPTPSSTPLPFASGAQLPQPRATASYLRIPIDFSSASELPNTLDCDPRNSLYFYNARQVATSVSNRLQYIPSDMTLRFPTTMA